MTILTTLQTYARGLARNFFNWAIPNPYLPDPRIERIQRVNRYRQGQQRKFIAAPEGKPDDNVIVNFVRLLCRRSVSYLFGEGIAIEHPDEPARKYLQDVYRRNNGVVFLRKLGLNGALAGTCYVKIIPDPAANALPRLVAVDPALVEIVTDPEDIDAVLEYVIRFHVLVDGAELSRKQTITRQEEGGVVTWLVTEWVEQYGAWVKLKFADGRPNPLAWDYPFPPLVHWQNLTAAGSPYGEPDITDDVLALQDKINFNASNVSKLIRLYLDPKIWGRQLGDAIKTNWGVGKILNIASENGAVGVLDTNPDLTGAQEFVRFLRQALFDICQQIDLDSIQDKLGGLTNFGLKILFGDAMSLIAMKRDLYGEGLVELNRRLLILNGAPETVEGGKIIWPAVLPVDEKDQAETLALDLRSGLVSKATASARRGYDWAIEQPLLDDDDDALSPSLRASDAFPRRHRTRRVGNPGRSIVDSGDAPE